MERDYRQRFRERFPFAITDFSKEPWGNVMNDILAFIDEEIERERIEWHKYGFEGGVEEERAALIEKIEGMRKRVIFDATYCVTCKGHQAAGECDCLGYNQALDDLLTHLRGDSGHKPRTLGTFAGEEIKCEPRTEKK